MIVKLTLRLHALAHRKHSLKKKMTTPYPTIKNSLLLITNYFRKTHQQIIKIISAEWAACIAGSGGGGDSLLFRARKRRCCCAGSGVATVQAVPTPVRLINVFKILLTREPREVTTSDFDETEIC